MYNLGEQFVLNKQRAIANSKNVVKGEKYRFTVLTERLIRLEYSETGTFVDNPTELVLYRDLQTPKFNCREDANFIVISTDYFKLTYLKNKPFLGNKVSKELSK